MLVHLSNIRGESLQFTALLLVANTGDYLLLLYPKLCHSFLVIPKNCNISQEQQINNQQWQPNNNQQLPKVIAFTLLQLANTTLVIQPLYFSVHRVQSFMVIKQKNWKRFIFHSQQTLDPKWERFACGKTKDQLFMTQLAHMILKKTSLQPRSLNFSKHQVRCGVTHY